MGLDLGACAIFFSARSKAASSASAPTSSAVSKNRFDCSGSSGFVRDFLGIGSIQGRNPTLVIACCADQQVLLDIRNNPLGLSAQDERDQAAISALGIVPDFPVYLPTLRQRMAGDPKR